MIKEFYTKRLLIIIIFVAMLLMMCVTFDYAENNTITNINNSLNYSSIDEVILPNNTSVVNVNESASNIIVKSSDKIYTTKQKTITITSKPSCGCGYGYYWHTFTFVNYCPHCHKTGTLRNVHKWQARYEQELTCDTRLGGCGADYCGCCGKEKYSGSRFYLRRA